MGFAMVIFVVTTPDMHLTTDHRTCLSAYAIPGDAQSRFFKSKLFLVAWRTRGLVDRVPTSSVRSTRSGNSGSARFDCRPGIVEFRYKSTGDPPPGFFSGIAELWKLGAQRRISELQAYGLAGIAAYGILNTLYYTCAFVFAWVFVVKPEPGMGIVATSKKFVEAMGLVWAGSQVTKLIRLGSALLLAPIVDRALDFIMIWLQLATKQKAFLVLVFGCLSIALGLFAAILAVWA